MFVRKAGADQSEAPTLGWVPGRKKLYYIDTWAKCYKLFTTVIYKSVVESLLLTDFSSLV
jgi:hypothetical protein